MNNYDIIYSLQRYFSDKFGLRADWVVDGYEYPSDKPFVTLEYITNEWIDRAKRQEAVQVTELLQIGYHASNAVDMTKTSERIADSLTFNKIPYFNTSKSVVDSAGFFGVKIVAVVPMGASEKNRESEYHRVYIDAEIEKIKRRC